MTSMPNGTAAVLPLQPLPERAELVDHRSDRVLPGSAEQEARMEDDDLRPARRRDARASVESPHGRGELPAGGLQVAHEPEQGSVDRERDVGVARDLSEPLCERVVHPEPALEVDLARAVAALEDELERRLRRLAGRHARGADANPGHAAA